MEGTVPGGDPSSFCRGDRRAGSRGLTELPQAQRMEQVGEEDGRQTGVEQRMEQLVFAKEQGRGEAAVDRLEVHREVRGVGAHPAQQVDVEGVGEDRAGQREQQQPQPVESLPEQQRNAAIEQGMEGQRHRASARHFPGDHHQRIAAGVDQTAVEDREDRGEHGTEQGDGEA